jgi:4-hydroxy-2-oxoheptanedioate aldolase
MKPRPARILSLLRQGKLANVLKINLSDPRVLEIAGLSGVDALWLCNEHVPNDWCGLENQIRAARVHDVDTIVRVARGSYSDYIRPFEAGASGIIVPHVANVQEARQIIEWVRFQPIGKRALDGGNIDGQFCLISATEYLEYANTEQMVILQIESPEALENVEAIAALPGFNGFLFGPGDFSHRIGKPGQVNAPEVVAARQRVARAAVQNGKFAMTAGLLAPVADLFREGHSVFNIGADVVGLANYVRERLELVRGQAATIGTNTKQPSSPYAA